MYNTKQKQTLIDFLKKNKNKHFSIKEISQYVTENRIGKSTIYRLIDKMTAEGSIRRFRGNDGKSVLYQYIGDSDECNGHFHLKCTSCGLLIHLDCKHITYLNEHINEHHQFTIDIGKTILYGLCSKCKKGGEKLWKKSEF